MISPSGSTTRTRTGRLFRGWVLMFLLGFVCIVCDLHNPCLARSQKIVSDVLGEGEKDTVRVDVRTPGETEKIGEYRLEDQRTGWEEKSGKEELREKTLLRKQEEMAHVQRMQKEREARETLERREREEERIRDKKKRFVIGQ